MDALARVLTSANIRLDREVPVNGKERPADILAYRLLGSSPVAIDVTVVHLLATSSDYPQNRVSSAELGKHRHYDKLCSDAGFSFNACGFSTFGGAAPDAQLVLLKIKQRIAEIHGKAEGIILGHQASERIVVSVTRVVAAQLIEATSFGASAPGIGVDASTPEYSETVIGAPESEALPPMHLAQRVSQQCPQHANIITERLLARGPGEEERLQGNCSLPTAAINDEV